MACMIYRWYNGIRLIQSSCENIIFLPIHVMNKKYLIILYVIIIIIIIESLFVQHSINGFALFNFTI